ncbi:MAG: carbohydrate ABC transporter permease [Actinobacteria bacterium]|nr:carbohydrate ABC transporter permease [Actinomycetota bacterium]
MEKDGLRKKNKNNVVTYLILGLLVVVFLIPIYVLVITGFKSFEEFSLSTMWLPPKTWHFENYIESFKTLLPNAKNSFIMVPSAAILSSLIGSFNGYILSKWKFKGSNYVFAAILLGMFIPYQAILIPLVQFLKSIGLYSSLPGLILAHTVYGIPITSLIFRNYYAEIPNELVEVTKIDGGGIFDIYFRILLPLSLPGFAVATIWQFTSIWNDFLFGVIITPNPKLQPITVALRNIAGSLVVEWNMQMSAALISTIPTLTLYLLLGRYFIRGLLAGSLKG